MRRWIPLQNSRRPASCLHLHKADHGGRNGRTPGRAFPSAIPSGGEGGALRVSHEVRVRGTGSETKDRAEIVVDLPGRVEIDVELSGPGMLVLTDAFYPGWKVTVDDDPGFAIPVYGCVRGVSLTGSEKKVVFRYEPASFSWGLAVTLLGLALWSGGFYWTSRHRRRSMQCVKE